MTTLSSIFEQFETQTGVQPVPADMSNRPTSLPIRLIEFYQHAAVGRPSPCRFTPSCSSYAIESLERHGLMRGSWLAVRRIGRCHPLGGHGFDPVPE